MVSYTYGKTLLKIENVSLEYDGRAILKNVSAEIKDIIRDNCVQGQVVGFLGPSGIGKTQLFRIIAGLNPPTSGRVTINGLDRPVRAGEVGVVAQDYPLFEHRTVLSNLLLAAGQKEREAYVAQEKVIKYFNEFELIDNARLNRVELSGGQRQRCAITSRFCSTHLQLMVESISGIYVLMLERTCALIQKVVNMDELNTIIVVTHDVTAAASVSDHLWLMGRDKDARGNPLPGSHIVETYDLIERDLCWHPEIITHPKFGDFVREVKDRFRSL
jgi:polar amino acid transport system ATP-binding protein/sulfate transport system ATP-binding protein